MNISPSKPPLEFRVQIYRVIPFAVLCSYGQIILFNLLIIRVNYVGSMDIFTHDEEQCAISSIELV